jgi:hypothetical protein
MTRLRDEAAAARPAIEARLCLGMPATQAFAPHLHMALRTALIPSIDSTKTVGLISLPGAMTGLILAGVSPLTAIRYQIVVMWMLLAAAGLAALSAARLAERALFDDAHRLRPLRTRPAHWPGMAGDHRHRGEPRTSRAGLIGEAQLLRLMCAGRPMPGTAQATHVCAPTVRLTHRALQPGHRIRCGQPAQAPASAGPARSQR